MLCHLPTSMLMLLMLLLILPVLTRAIAVEQ
jgi:hypothetical protein